MSDLLSINIWGDFHFLRPTILWLLLPAAIISIISLLTLRETLSWRKSIAPHLRKYVITKGSEGKRKWMQLFLTLFLSIAIFGVAGPSWRKVELPEKTLETPLLIILNLSESMLKTDIQPNRLERAKFKINDLLDANPGARTALMGYAGSAHTIIPLTRDYSIIKSHISSLSPSIMPVAGSNLKEALTLTDTVLKNISAPGNILLFSDYFNDEVSNILQDYSSTHNHKITVLPIIPIANTSPETASLKKLESIVNINVAKITLDKSDVELIAKNIRESLQFKDKDLEKEDEWQDDGLWFALPLALFLLMWFRKGWVIYSLFFALITTSCNGDKTFKDLWLSRDYQAQKAYNKGDFESASQLFENHVHKGVAYFKLSDFDKAIDEFSKDSSAIGAYNLGLAYYNNGDFASAALAFGQATELDPNMENASKNVALMQQLIEANNNVSLKDAEEAENIQTEENIENKDMEDLSGGGQEATEEDMEKERKEETVSTDISKAKELEEVPDDFVAGKRDDSQKVMMRKVDDDPSIFLERKFRYQIKLRQSNKNPDKI
jgi:Ca-activated chloride channel family protein